MKNSKSHEGLESRPQSDKVLLNGRRTNKEMGSEIEKRCVFWRDRKTATEGAELSKHGP